MAETPPQRLVPEAIELTISDGRKVTLSHPDLEVPARPNRAEERGATDPPRDDPRWPFDPDPISGT